MFWNVIHTLMVEEIKANFNLKVIPFKKKFYHENFNEDNNYPIGNKPCFQQWPSVK